MNLLQIWHYHRPELAKIYLDTLNAGLVTSTTIFAPRRAGKTSFLRKDLSPAAESAGYVVVYADLWQTRLSPGVSLVRALEQALENKTALQNITAKLKVPVRKLKASAELAGSRLEGELEFGSGDKKIQTEIALHIDMLIEELCRKKPVLLLIDEAQELAKTREHEAVATALRTAMIKNQARLRVVFTGSSRTQLAHVFSNSDAPLYSTGAAIMDFPLLDRNFVDYVADKFAASTQRRLPIAQAWEFFLKFKQQPEPFLMGIVDMVLNPARSMDDAMTLVAEKLAHADNHEGVWAQLDATQKALARMLAKEPATKPFSNATLMELRRQIGVDALKTTHVQRAMSKLESIVVKTSRDTYEFENAALAHWIRTLVD